MSRQLTGSDAVTQIELEGGQIWRQKEGSFITYRRITVIVQFNDGLRVFYKRRFDNGEWSPLDFEKLADEFCRMLVINDAELVGN